MQPLKTKSLPLLDLVIFRLIEPSLSPQTRHVCNTLMSHRYAPPKFSGINYRMFAQHYHLGSCATNISKCYSTDGMDMTKSLSSYPALSVSNSPSLVNVISNRLVVKNNSTLPTTVSQKNDFAQINSIHLNCDKYHLQRSSINSILKFNRLSTPNSETLKMLSNVINRFMSTVTNKSAISRNGSGMLMTDADEPESLLSNTKANKHIKINACGELYNELSKTKPHLYVNAPKNRGIDFDLRYYDSLDLLDSSEQLKAPIVCLLHGAPGHYKDFASLINYLTKKGCRVIAPSFPDYSATFEHSFRHSPRERVAYLLKFFEGIKVNRIDMLVGHSSAVYTIFELLNHSFCQQAGDKQPGANKLRIKSLGLFNTPTYNLPPNMAVTPMRLFTLKLFDYPLFRPIILALVSTFVRLQGIRNKVDRDKIENLLIAASAVGYSDCDKTQDYLKLVQKFKVPTFLVVGCKDRLIPMKSFEQLKRDLGITTDKQVKHYNEIGGLKSDAKEIDELVEVSQFASGGHYTFQKYSTQVNEDVHSFLERKVFSAKVESTWL